MVEPPKIYEKQLQKLESEVRTHIRVREDNVKLNLGRVANEDTYRGPAIKD